MDEKPDWSVFFKGDKYKGKLAMRDYAVEGIMIAALYLGIPLQEMFKMDDSQLAEVQEGADRREGAVAHLLDLDR